MRAQECPPHYLSISSSCAVDFVRTVPRTASSRTSLARACVLVPEQVNCLMRVRTAPKLRCCDDRF